MCFPANYFRFFGFSKIAHLSYNLKRIFAGVAVFRYRMRMREWGRERMGEREGGLRSRQQICFGRMSLPSC